MDFDIRTWLPFFWDSVTYLTVIFLYPLVIYEVKRNYDELDGFAGLSCHILHISLILCLIKNHLKFWLKIYVFQISLSNSLIYCKKIVLSIDFGEDIKLFHVCVELFWFFSCVWNFLGWCLIMHSERYGNEVSWIGWNHKFSRR